MQEFGARAKGHRFKTGLMRTGLAPKPFRSWWLWHVLLFVLAASIQSVQRDAWAFDGPEDWFPPVILTFQLAIGEPIGVVAGDIQADGIPDLVLITHVNLPTFFETPKVDYVIKVYLLPGTQHGWGEAVLIGLVPAPERYLFSRAIVSGVDLDRDGYQEVVAVLTLASGPPAALDLDNLETRLIILWGQDLRGTGQRLFAMDHMRVDVGLLPPTSIIYGDFNGDGLLDLAYNDPQNLSIHIHYNRGERRFAGPQVVAVATEKDKCFPVPIKLRSARLDREREGHDIVMAGPCALDQDNYKQFVRFLLACGEHCWELSSLLLTSPVRGNLDDVLGDLMIGDFDVDGRTDVVFTQKLLSEQLETELRPPTTMGVYLLSGVGRGELGAPVLIGNMLEGALLSVEFDANGHWKIVGLSVETKGVVVLHVGLKERHSASLPTRGYAVDAVLVNRGDGREIVVVSSLDLRSGITLLNVVTRRSP